MHLMIFSNFSLLGAILIVCGLYVVLWGENKEMKKKLSALVPSEKIEKQKSLEIIVASGSDGSSLAEMRVIENDISERKEVVMPSK